MISHIPMSLFGHKTDLPNRQFFRKKNSFHFLILLFLVSGIHLDAQQGPPLTHTAELLIPCRNCTDLMVDPLGQIYLIEGDTRLAKYSPTGTLQHHYENQALGKLHSVDVSNPMKVFLFYRDLSKVVILENTLAEVLQIDLTLLGFQDVSAAAPSNDNQLWLFDRFSLLLMKISPEGNILLKSDPVQMLTASRVIPDYIVQRDTRVYLNDWDNGILIFDQYAQFIRDPKIRPGRYVSIAGEQVYYTDGTTLVSYTGKLNDIRTRSIDPEFAGPVLKVVVTEEYAYYLTEKGVYRE